MQIKVQEVALPGIGTRYDVVLEDGRRLFVVAERTGRRDIGLHSDDDEPAWQISLDPDHAVMVAALLLGARFTLDTRADVRRDADEVVVDTVTLKESSPAIGKIKAEIPLGIPEATVLAVISDATRDLVEHETSHRCRPGDRVVIAARAAQIEELTKRVGG